MLERFARLMFPMLGLCVLAVAGLASFTSVNGMIYPQREKDYYAILNDRQAALELRAVSNPSDKLRTELAMTRLQNKHVAEASNYFHEAWLKKTQGGKSGYDEEYLQNALNLGSSYIAQVAYDQAFDIYKIVLTYDQSYLPKDDTRIGRDHNNLGLASYLRASKTLDLSARQRLMDQALQQYKSAEQIFRKNGKSSTQLAFNMQNQALAWSELGDESRADELRKASDQEFAKWRRARASELQAATRESRL